MGNFKYQFFDFRLFDYTGVEKHLEKMAAKGWQFVSVGSYWWKYKKAEPAKVKYSVTYVPEATQFAPEPLEKQMDIDAYCEEAGWKKVGTWMQMQIFRTENPDAVPIETDEELRLDAIHGSMKKNFWTHLLLLLLFILNANNLFSAAKDNIIVFLASGSTLWVFSLWLWGILLLAFDTGYYIGWYCKAKRRVKNGMECPRPRLYRYIMRVYWLGVILLIFGLLSGYSTGMAVVMALFIIGYLLVIVLIHKLQMHLKTKGVSKAGNVVITLISSFIVAFVLVGGVVGALVLFDIRPTNTSNVKIQEYNGRDYFVYSDKMPLYTKDFMTLEGDYLGTSTHAEERESILVGYGEYRQSFFTEDGSTLKLHYHVITAKAKFLYDFLLKEFHKQEFLYFGDVFPENTEFKPVYEKDGAVMYRKYFFDSPVWVWLLCTGDKIIGLRNIELDDLTEEQMNIIIEKFAE